MDRKTTGEPGSREDSSIRFSLGGLALFSVSLVLATGLLSYGLVRVGRTRDGDASRRSDLRPTGSEPVDIPPAEMPPWGELLSRDIELEQPEEYVAFSVDTNRVATWTFEGMTVEQVRDLMLSCGLASNRVANALSSRLTSETPGSVAVTPDDELVLSLSAENRAKLYHELARSPANGLIRYPFSCLAESFDGWLKSAKLEGPVSAELKKLIYRRGDAVCFSDYEALLRRIPSESERLRLLKELSRESAVLARLRIRPDTDIDKLLGYWSRGIQVKDVRPLLESLERLPEGGSISILHLLPPFARERLYTFPQPARPGDPSLDCHWSTMNFFNETPDNRFANGSYTAAYLATNYYSVAKPTLYGDLIFLLDEGGGAFHSAVYIADDIVFTKNGNTFAQPWKLMRLKDLEALYVTESPQRVVVYRNRNW